MPSFTGRLTSEAGPQTHRARHAPVNESSSSANACSSCKLYSALVSGWLSTAYACGYSDASIISRSRQNVGKSSAFMCAGALQTPAQGLRTATAHVGRGGTPTSFKRMQMLWPCCPRKSGWHDFARPRYADLMTSGEASSSTCAIAMCCKFLLQGREATVLKHLQS